MVNIQAKTAHILTNRVEDNLDLRCGNCGGLEFAIHVKVKPNGAAWISRCKCMRCGKIRVFDDKGVLQSSGRVDLKKIKTQ